MAGVGAVNWESIRKEVTCLLCNKLFQDPKLLPCLHTYCLECLYKKSMAEKLPKNKTRIVVNCVQCDVTSDFSAEKLTSNTWAKYLVDIVSKQDQLTSTPTPSCQSCLKKETAISICTNQSCGLLLCASCEAIHKNVLASHVVCSNVTALSALMDQQQAMCPTHSDKLAEFFCIKEKCLVCFHCIATIHSDCGPGQHCVYDMQNSKKLMEEIDLILPSIKRNFEESQLCIWEIEQFIICAEEREEKNKETIKKLFQEIKGDLEQKKEKLIDKVNTVLITRKLPPTQNWLSWFRRQQNVEVLSSRELGSQRDQLKKINKQMKECLAFHQDEIKSGSVKNKLSIKESILQHSIKLQRTTIPHPRQFLPPDVSEAPIYRLKDFLLFEKGSVTTAYKEQYNFKLSMKDSSGKPIHSLADVVQVSSIETDGIDKKGADVTSVKVYSAGKGECTFAHATEATDQWINVVIHVKGGISKLLVC